MITDRARLRTYECDGLAHYKVTPALVGAAAAPPLRWPTWCGRASTRTCRTSPAGPAPGCPAARCRTPTACSSSRRRCARIVDVDPADQRAVVEPGVINLQVTPVGGRRRLLLRPRPVQPADLLDRRQRGGELRRRALPEVRLHHQPRHRARGGRTRRQRGAARRPGAGPARLRPARCVRRLGGHARHRHRGDRAADARAARRCARCSPRSRRPTRPAARCRRSSAPASCRPRSR